MDKKWGVYICTGCGIGGALDVDALAKVVKSEFKQQNCKNHPFLCSKEGVDLIKADIADGVNTIVIPACSSRVKYEEFRFGPGVIVDRVNIREQVAWSHTADDEDTQMLAEDLLRMAMTKVKLTELPEPWQVENLSKDVLVVGGGIAGMTAAMEAAKAGYKAVIVEKGPALGGYVGKMYKVAPTKVPYDVLPENPVPALTKAIEDNPNIKVYTGATVESIAGGPGTFDVKIKSSGGTVDERAGAVILATGSVPFDPAKLGHLGYGKFPQVITQADFEQLAIDGKLKDVERVGFIQCAGSRDVHFLSYCSAACCVESLKQARYLKEQNPAGQAYVFYKDLRAVGKYEYLYKQVQADGTVFIKGEVANIVGAGGKLTVEIDDAILGEKVAVQGLDYIVLANGMVPTTAFGTEPGQTEAEAEAAAAKEKGEEDDIPKDVILKSDLLNLKYRQGPELPTLKYGFPDSHFVCFPYESRRTGIYPVGTVRNPMHVAAAMEDATGAAMKAIQCIEACAAGKAVHPRSGDESYPEFAMQRCTQCKRCTEECPFGAINEDEKGNPLPERTRCRRCGTCMGACPERIISFKNYSVGMIGNMAKAVEVPDEEDEKPRILIFACENDAIPALDMAGLGRLQYNAWIRVIPVRCLGSLNLVWISDAMSKGFDGVLLLGCKHGDDYQCHFMKGSELAEIRLSKVSETLDRLGLESERVRFKAISIMDYTQIPSILDSFSERLAELGPNPMKGF
ncbi:MAG: FAD-dependent oxidoreductase [Clostridia bacterium]|nr:FAD-dependent oxidoreductase [Clostridia bacterium]MDQ7791621.1 FAD-dependent oxidoreductase [Clostridia bacterium]